jgi:hypothetical protein
MRNVIASGRIAAGCGFTTTALPVVRSAKRPDKHSMSERSSHDEADTARHDSKSLFIRIGSFALRFFPQRFCRNAAQLSHA